MHLRVAQHLALLAPRSSRRSVQASTNLFTEAVQLRENVELLAPPLRLKEKVVHVGSESADHGPKHVHGRAGGAGVDEVLRLQNQSHRRLLLLLGDTDIQNRF